MDIYGCYRIDRGDFLIIAENLKKYGTIIFPFFDNESGCYIITISQDFKILGKLPYGGSPLNRKLVSIQGIGAFHFDFSQVSIDYISEKLNLDKKSSHGIYQLFKGILNEENN